MRNENFDDNITEFDVHYGRHCLLSWPEKGRTKADTQVAHRHQILFTSIRNPVKAGLCRLRASISEVIFRVDHMNMALYN